MEALFSPLLVSLGQTAAILGYLLYRDPEALRCRSRVLLVCGFFALHCCSQTLLHHYVTAGGMGSLPTLPFLFITWCIYALFLLLWSCAKWGACCFVAFVLLLVDNCIWPLLSGLSRLVWGINYLYEGSLLLRLPFILALSLLEVLLVLFIRHLLPEIHKIQLNLYDAILAVTIVIPFLYFRYLAGQSLDQVDKTVQIVMTVCCLAAVITLAAEVGHSSSEYEKMREAQMRSVLQSQQAMFEQKLNDIDQINRKYHDMKNLLLYLRANAGSEQLDASLDELLGSIAPYSKAVATGNDVIDVVLSEKLAICSERGIACMPYLDGTLFSYVKPLDLCTLVGNAMDNAIESCSQIPEADRRYIHLSSAAKGDSSLLVFRNTFQVKPDLRDGLPATTKADKRGHGYGLQNMSRIAEAYGGILTCRVEDEEFVLTVLLNRPPRDP